MKEIRLLFLAPNWRVTLIDAFQEAKSRFPRPIRLHGGDSDPQAAALQMVDTAHTLPAFSESGCVNEVLDICRNESIDNVIPLTNKAIEFLDCHRDSFPDAGLLGYLEETSTIAVAHDKWALARFCRQNDIDTPDTWTVDELKGKAVFPMIAKPLRGEGSKAGFLIEDDYDLEYCIRKYPGHVIQEYVKGREYSIDWFSTRSGEPLVVVPRERVTVRAGEVMVSKIEMNPQLIEAARKIGTLLNLKGPCTLQGILEKSGRFVFTDVNLRFGSGSVHTILCGADVPTMIFNEIAGESPNSVPLQVQNGSLMTRYPEGLFI